MSFYIKYSTEMMSVLSDQVHVHPSQRNSILNDTSNATDRVFAIISKLLKLIEIKIAGTIEKFIRRVLKAK